MPTVSKLGANPIAPVMDAQPLVGLKPTSPQYEAGARAEPAVSVTIDAKQRCAATPAALPLLEPPVA